jgi:hypothetical protein
MLYSEKGKLKIDVASTDAIVKFALNVLSHIVMHIARVHTEK